MGAQAGNPGRGPRGGGFSEFAAVMEGRAVSALLSLLLVVSVLPLGPLGSGLWPVYVAVFAVELAYRAVAFQRTPPPRFGPAAILVTDAIAFVSFFPLDAWVGLNHEVMVAIRLARLLVLMRFVKEVARDAYSVMTRREQVEQFGLVTAVVLFLAFISATLLSQLEVPHDYADGVEAPNFVDKFWWAFRQLESADNLVQTVRINPLVAALSLLLTVAGVFLVSFIIGLGSNIVGQVVVAERRRPLHMRRHTLVLGPVHENGDLVQEFVRIYAKNGRYRRFRLREFAEWVFRRGPGPRRLAYPQIALMAHRDEPPQYLYDAGMRGIVYREGDAAAPEDLERISAYGAKRAILLAEPNAGRDVDAVTIARLGALRTRNRTAHVFLEIRESRNLPLAAAVGGEGAFAIDVNRFVGLFLAHHLVTPGADTLYRDLLTADGSEFYTYVYAEPKELDALEARAAREPTANFAHLAKEAYERFGVVLVGVFIGQGHLLRGRDDLIPVHALTQWANPLEPPAAEPVVHAGGAAGEVPVRHLRGFIGVATTYGPVRDFGAAFLAGEVGAGRTAVITDSAAPKTTPARLQTWLTRSRFNERPVTRVVVIGYSSALPSFVRGLCRFVPDVEIIAFVSARGDAQTSMRDRLAHLGFESEAVDAEQGVIRMELARGGRAEVHVHEGENLVDRAVAVLKNSAPIDAAAFLADPESYDADARTLLRALRFADALEAGIVPRAERLHVLVEFQMKAKGEPLRERLRGQRCGYAEDERVRLTMVSTDELRSYFMVHSAFVPGVTDLYETLLSAEEDELLRLDLPNDPAAAPEGDVGLGELLEAFASERIIPVGFEDRSGRIWLNPPPGHRMPIRDIAAVFVFARHDTVRRRFARPENAGTAAS